ncbi:MAG: hypothetical protein U0271_22155 [Polyangiaceae bacterium]
MRRVAAALILVALAYAPRPAAADEDDSRRFSPSDFDFWEPQRFRIEVSSGAGVAYSEGLDAGGYARLSLEASTIASGDRRSPRLAFSMRLGFDAWGTADARGFGLPMTAYIGVRYGDERPHNVLVGLRLGLGWSLFTADKVAQVWGGGVFAPQAGGDLTLDVGPVRFGFESHVQYRWEWSIDDRVQIQVGTTLGVPLQTK